MYPLGGTTPIEQAPIFTNTSLEVAIVATPHSDETVLFTGDNRGYIKKVRKSSGIEQNCAAYAKHNMK